MVTSLTSTSTMQTQKLSRADETDCHNTKTVTNKPLWYKTKVNALHTPCWPHGQLDSFVKRTVRQACQSGGAADHHPKSAAQCTVLAGDTAHWKYNATGPQVCLTVFSNAGSFSPVVLGNHHGILPYLLLLHDLWWHEPHKVAVMNCLRHTYNIIIKWSQRSILRKHSMVFITIPTSTSI